MFEYLMPNLLMPTYPNSLIYESLRFCVYCQKLRGADLKIPWGISDSAFFAFVRQLNYQLKAHCVQRLAFKRGMNRELVISPYSTYLALEVEPAASIKNLRRLEMLPALKADMDYRRPISHLPGRSAALVRACDALWHTHRYEPIACDNLLNDNVMQRVHGRRGNGRICRAAAGADTC